MQGKTIMSRVFYKDATMEHEKKMIIEPGSAAIYGAIKLGVAAFFGVLVRLIHDPTINFKYWMMEVVAGVSSAIFLTPLVVHYAALPSNLDYGVAFVIGLTAQTTVIVIQKKIVGKK